jgi:hypothetical protein
MNKFIFIILMLLTHNIFADECFEQAKSFGGLNSIDESCFHSRHAQNSHQHHLHVKVENFKVWADINAIWILHPKRGLVPIAGENTRLHQIIAIASSQTEPEIAVLQINEELQKEILVFNLNFPGHVKPRRLIESPRLKNAISLSFDNAREKILVVLESGQVFEFQLKADDRSVHQSQKAKWQKIQFPGQYKIVDLAATTDALMTLTADGRLCTYTIAQQYLQECLQIDEIQSPLDQMRYFHHHRLLELSNEQEFIQFLLD